MKIYGTKIIDLYGMNYNKKINNFYLKKDALDSYYQTERGGSSTTNTLDSLK